ncbi:helix-turn-helix domain-containing protein [Streptomyces sp. NPDC127119]|uniref:helix-turn-helix domain-containing protein n=1 Tax=Streptomyces sp. NPDC127119 TaxID=3345370 RepID=UPI003643847D
MKSLYDRFASSEDGAQLLAAARLRHETLRVLQRALSACGLNQSQLADRLGIKKSAVSQVFRGDGNLRITTIAQYLNAMGYELDIRVVAAGEPRKAVVEGREVVPALTQDWIETDTGCGTSCTPEIERMRFSTVQHAGPERIKVRFTPGELSSTLVEMRSTTTSYGTGEALYEGPTEVTKPALFSDQDFHPLRSGANS